MTSKRAKRHTVDLVTPDRPTEINIDYTPAECDRLRKEVDHKNEVFSIPLGFVCVDADFEIGHYFVGGFRG